MSTLLILLVLFSLLLLLFSGWNEAATFTIINSCSYTVWPGILSNAGVAPLSTTGFSLDQGSSISFSTPSSWAGRFWARTLCSTNSSTSHFSCLSGDCGSGDVSCSGSGASPPATLAEFTLDGSGGLDFYDVSLVDGYNLPMLVAPRGGSGPNCTVTGCVVDLNGACPSGMRVQSTEGSNTVACRSACDAFNTPQYCCSGTYGSPDTCKPSSYSMVFKKACPSAYSYAYDDKSSTFTCAGSPDYTITLCPSPATSQKASSSSGDGEGAGPGEATPSSASDGIMSGSMVYEGALDDSSATSTCQHLIASVIATLTVICHLIRL